MDLSIIIPVYNVEKYIRTCIKSVFRQGIDENRFEVIIVNDGTPDRSIEVIADIVKEHKNTIITEQQNQGLSVARNNGIEKASGEYILWVDSDDLLIDNSLSYLLDKAISSKADLVVADFVKMTNEQIAQLQDKPLQQKDGRTQEKTGKELHTQDLNPYSCHVWRTLYKREFLNKNNLRFIPNIYFEDIPFTHQCYIEADLCLKVNWLLNIYRKGIVSITSTFNKKKAFDYCLAISKTWELTKEESLNEQQIMKIQNDTFIHYSMLIYSLTSCQTITRAEKTDVLYHLKKLIPDLSFNNSEKQRIVTFLYKRIPSVYMTLRILYTDFLQDLFWAIGDIIRHKNKTYTYDPIINYLSYLQR